LSGNVFSSEATPSQFLQQQVHLLAQLKWFIGVLFIAFGILYAPRKALTEPTYSGPKDVVITNLGIPCGECDLYVPCYCYSLTYDDSNLYDTDYIDCDGNPQVLVPDVKGTYKVCSRTTPVPQTISDNPAVITQLGLCDQFPECSEATCFCWLIDSFQDCEVETTCQGLTTTTTLLWNGIYILCSETEPTSICGINPVKVKTCDPNDPCWNVNACLCFQLETTAISTIVLIIMNIIIVTFINVFFIFLHSHLH
jgi:hypothetical protein